MKKTLHRKYKWPLNTKRCLKFIIIEEIHIKITSPSGVNPDTLVSLWKSGFLINRECELEQSSWENA